MSRIQSLLVRKTESGRPIEERIFWTTNEARLWLRKEGCRFRNDILTNLQKDELNLANDRYEYRVEASALQRAERVSANGKA